MPYPMPDEDAYWEAVRERLENPRHPPDWEPEPESGWLFLDDEEESLEAEYGCKLAELTEADLMDILNRLAEDKQEWISAEWDENLCGIEYTYRAAA